MKIIKNLFTTGIVFIILGLTFLYREDIMRLYANTFLYRDKVTTLESQNNYARDVDFYFVQQTSNFSPNNRQDLLNIYFSAINSGQREFTFFCPSTYNDCLDEVSTLANDQMTLSHINNFVHPFNSFTSIETEFDTLGRVTIRIDHTYTPEEIIKLNERVREIEEKLFVYDDMSYRDKILVVHDFIIDHTRYDTQRADYDIINYPSDKATGVFFYGMALCGGYTNAMALFLENMGLKHFRVSSESHIWNAVKLDGSWYHLDLTWNDPVTDDGTDILVHTFFLIDTRTLLDLDTGQHYFNKEVHSEVA